MRLYFLQEHIIAMLMHTRRILASFFAKHANLQVQPRPTQL